MKVQIFASPNIIHEGGDEGGGSKSIARYKQEVLNLKAIIQTLVKEARKESIPFNCVEDDAGYYQGFKC